jgi:hypothetical protein
MKTILFALAGIGGIFAVLLMLSYLLRGPQTREITLPAHIDDVWPLLRLSPDDKNWLPGIERIEWEPGSNTDAIVHYAGGYRGRYKQTFDDTSHELTGVIQMIDEHDQPFGDAMLVGYNVNAVAGGTHWRLTMEGVPHSRMTFVAWINRLLIAFSHKRLFRVVHQELRKRGAYDRFAKQTIQ